MSVWAILLLTMQLKFFPTLGQRCAGDHLQDLEDKLDKADKTDREVWVATDRKPTLGHCSGRPAPQRDTACRARLF